MKINFEMKILQWIEKMENPLIFKLYYIFPQRLWLAIILKE